MLGVGLGLFSSLAPNPELKAANSGAPPLLPSAMSKPKPEAESPSSELEAKAILPSTPEPPVHTGLGSKPLPTPKPPTCEGSRA